jgi:hypothetical protein
VSQFPWFVVEGQDLLPDGPIYTHFWYIRYLMGLAVVSPFLWIIVKKWPKLALITSGLLWMLHPSILHYSYQIGYLGFGALFFFMLGAYITKTGGTNFFFREIKGLIGIAFLFLISFVVYYSKCFSFIMCVDRIAILLGVVLLFSLASVLTKKGVMFNKKLSRASFMIYAMHLAFVPVWRVIWVEILCPSISLAQLSLWLLAVISNVVVCLIFDIITRKYVPKINTLLTGGR